MALAAGCSTLRVAYSNGSTLAWWSIDGWLDTSRQQAPAVRQAIDRWFDWHRRTQLGPTTALLAELRAQVLEPTTAEAVCRWNDRAQALFDPAIARALDEAAGLLPLLTEANLKAMEAKGRKELEEDRRVHLQGDPAQREADRFKRARERFERLYGRLAEPQLAVLREGLAGLPLEAERWIAERAERQQALQTALRRLMAEPPPPERRVAVLRTLVDADAEPVDPVRRERQQRLAQANCALSAAVHNAAPPAQRERARERLLGWENDLRSVMPADTAAAAAAAVRARPAT